VSKIEHGQFSSFLRRYLGMVGQSNVADELTAEISPGLELESERAEWEFLKGAKLMSMPMLLAGAAGTASAVKLRNPAASGVVAIFGKPFGPMLDIGAFTAAAAAAVGIRLHWQPEAADLATSHVPIPRDTRYTTVAAGTSALIGSGTNNLGATNLGDIWASAVALNRTMVRFDQSFVLTPGREVSVTCPELETTLLGTWNWLEKRLDQLEVS